MPAGKTYKDDFKATVLTAVLAAGGDITSVAKEYGVPIQTVSNWKRGVGVSAHVKQLMGQKRASLGERIEELAHLLLDHIPRKIKKAPLKEVVLALDSAVEKLQLLSGQATSIQGRVGLPDDQRLDAIANLIRAAQARRVESVPAAPALLPLSSPLPDHPGPSPATPGTDPPRPPCP